MLEKTIRAIGNEQTRDTGNIENKTQNEDKNNNHTETQIDVKYEHHMCHVFYNTGFNKHSVHIRFAVKDEIFVTINQMAFSIITSNVMLLSKH